LFIALRVLHQGCEAVLGKTCARISGEFVKHVTVAAMQQDVGHRRADLRAAGNRQKMALRLGVGDFDEIAVGKARGLRQDRSRDRDIVVSGKLPDDVAWRLIYWCKAPAKLLERFSLYPFDEVAYDVIEHVDLLIVEPIRIGNKKVGDPPQRIDAFVLGAALDRVLQLGYQ
jgi:hypothetical protein